MDIDNNFNINDCKNRYFHGIDEFIENSQENGIAHFQALSFNARSISSINKFNKFKEQLFLLPNLVHVIAISESWIRKEITQIYSIPNYKAEFSCREDGYGGVVLFIHESLKYKMNEINTGMLNSIEIEFPEICIRGKSIKLYTYYRSQKVKIDDFLEDLKQRLETNTDKNCLMLGDSNIDLSKDSIKAIKLKSLCETHNFDICNTNVTRPISKSIIDHVICNFHYDLDFQVDTIEVEKKSSDHNFLLTKINLNVHTSKYVIIRKKHIDYSAIKEELVCKFSNPIIDTYTNHDELCEYIIQSISASVHKFTKEYTIRKKQKHLLCPWVNSNLAKLIKHKRNLWRKCKRYPNNRNLKEKMERIEALIPKCFDDARNNYYRNRFKEVGTNPKAMWREVNEMLGKQKSQTIEKIDGEQGVTLYQPSEIAGEFNKYFSEVGKSMSAMIPKRSGNYLNIENWNNRNVVNESLVLESVSQNEVEMEIKELDINKSAGYDGITNKCIKLNMEAISPPLTKLVNQCINVGAYPKLLKIQKITPIYKEGDKLKTSNYRPISVLPAINRILERIIYKRLYSFLNGTNFFYCKQFGFRSGVSTTTAIMELTDMIINNFEEKKVISSVFLDLKKAFDTIDRTILLDKLKHAGIRGNSYRLLESYLGDRTQCVDINGVISELRRIDIGVPQGSVLGPLLFLIYINDMAKLPLKGTLLLFADDSSLFYPGVNVSENIEDMKFDLNLISEYMITNKMTLNIAKTQYVNFRPPNKKIPRTQLDFQGQIIEEASAVKYLGIIINNNLNWNEHIGHIIKKISPAIGIIGKFRNKIPTNVLRMIYHSLVQSHLTYMIEVWGSQRGYAFKSLQTLQKRALKNVYNLEPRFSTQVLFQKITSGILPVRGLYSHRISIWVYKRVHNLVYSNITFSRPAHGRGMRREHNLGIAWTKTEYGKQKISYIGPAIYNEIPDEVKTLNSLKKFENELKAWLISVKLPELLN